MAPFFHINRTSTRFGKIYEMMIYMRLLEMMLQCLQRQIAHFGNIVGFWQSINEFLYLPKTMVAKRL